MNTPELFKRPRDENLHYLSQSGQRVYQSKPTPTIITTEDRLFRRLTEHNEAFASSFGWAGPLAFFVTTIATMVTAEKYRNFIVDGPAWQAFFFILMILSFIWLVWEVFKTCKSLWHFRSFSASSGINHVIKKIKDDSDEWKSYENLPLETNVFPYEESGQDFWNAS